MPLARVKLSSNLIADLGADSLGLVELVLALEEAFDIEVPDELTENVHTVGDIVTLVQGCLDGDPPPERGAE
ncbi:MAG TPA: acyl carrier protein [Polyangiaceae bacterium]|nr:acyl carrier protein [Polyangiaceae bacterium]